MSNEKAKRVFLGMPGYGSVSMPAARGFYLASQSHKVDFAYSQSSLLANGFNQLWCSALNRQTKVGDVDYFAMQHADIEPDVGWLDMLIEELESNDLDVLGVVAPIKDHHGLTSIAIGDEETNWRVKCRLTMKEIFDLPETFTSDHIPGQLLLNTGLWVCRFDQRWVRKVHFEINDRIVQDAKTGLYRAEVEPEDWYFSRLCHELGLNIGCTRKVKLLHRGEQVFTNAAPWGDSFDESYLTESLLLKSECS
jgi:hypothetical protein